MLQQNAHEELKLDQENLESQLEHSDPLNASVDGLVGILSVLQAERHSVRGIMFSCFALSFTIPLGIATVLGGPNDAVGSSRPSLHMEWPYVVAATFWFFASVLALISYFILIEPRNISGTAKFPRKNILVKYPRVNSAIENLRTKRFFKFLRRSSKRFHIDPGTIDPGDVPDQSVSMFLQHLRGAAYHFNEFNVQSGVGHLREAIACESNRVKKVNLVRGLCGVSIFLHFGTLIFVFYALARG